MSSRLPALIAALALAACALASSGCVSKGEFERMKEEIAAAKGDVDKLQKLAAAQAQDLKLLAGTVESLKDEIAQLRAAAAAQPEKAQNKATGAKPKAKKKKKK